METEFFKKVCKLKRRSRSVINRNIRQKMYQAYAKRIRKQIIKRRDEKMGINYV